MKVTDTTRVRLHDLAVRQDRHSWVVGRVETGDFIDVPAEGNRAIELLRSGLSVGAVRAGVREVHGVELDIAGLVRDLVEIGFVQALDERPVHQPPPPPASLEWLRPRHVAWTLHPLTVVVVAGIVLVGTGLLIAGAAPMPSYHDLLWSAHGSVALVGDAALGWAITFAHELAHLCTARAAGVPARISLSTRLQFLVAQTDVTGIWAVPRLQRVTVYLAGIAVDLTLASLASITLALTSAGPARQFAGAVLAITVLGAAAQLLLFTRTDLYFLVQDLAGTRNLYAHARQYLRYRTAQILDPHGGPARKDPTSTLPTRERRIVLIYTPILLCGTAVCLAIAMTITAPAAVTLLSNATHTLLTTTSTRRAADAAATLLVIAASQLVWAATWWRGHSSRRSGAAYVLHPTTQKGGDTP